MMPYTLKHALSFSVVCPPPLACAELKAVAARELAALLETTQVSWPLWKPASMEHDANAFGRVRCGSAEAHRRPIECGAPTLALLLSRLLETIDTCHSHDSRESRFCSAHS